ncbi:MAG: ATP-binding cassette domain-containing protein [Verrucomicrobia bacterium]|nr:ATP-binding cassette domain-containing protein [Verrucomicrobiota bacterium]MCH8527693.1 ATP-binding cassette domain-containing protein [Kiritimatiellia bacterium]
MSNILELENVNISFEKQPVLREFCLTLRAGERVVLRGPSGCGKSTLLRCILGFANPDTGSIRIFGEELTASSVWPLRQKLAYVPQEPELGDGRGRDALERPFHYLN